LDEALRKLHTGDNNMNTNLSQKSQTTQKEATPVLWTELNDDVASQLSGGGWQFVPNQNSPYKFTLKWVD